MIKHWEEFELKSEGVCDNHMHMKHPEKIDTSLSILKIQREYFSLDGVQLCCMPNYDVSENYKAFYMKSKLDGVYVSAGLRHFHDERDTADGYLEQIKEAHKMGCDGIKMLEGKMKLHRTLSGKLCDPIFDKFYAYAEENKLPIVLHLGDPVWFWDITKLDQYALDNGWYCTPEDPTLEELRQEVTEVLEKFPELTLVLAHFYFMSDDISRVEKMFEKWKNLHFDLTPNGYMYPDFSAKYDEWREFFIKYSDRIIYGTDTYVRACDESNVSARHRPRPTLVRKFLEHSESFPEPTLKGEMLRPFALPEEIREKIYRGNFKRLYGEKPAPLDNALIAKKCRELLSEELDPLTKENVEIITAHFETK